MKNASILTLLVLAILFGACSKKSGGGVKLRADVDSVAYILGLNVGQTLLQRDSSLNVNALCEGIRDAFRERPRMTMEEARTYFLRYQNYTLPEKARRFEEQFLADFAKSNRSYARTQSGVTYAVEEVGDQGQIPAVDRDSVVMRILIRSIEGDELYSSYERGDSLYLPLRDMVDGMKECVRLIGKGGRILAWIPSEKAYGADGNAEFGIQPNTTIFCEIDLLEVDKYATRSRRRNSR